MLSPADPTVVARSPDLAIRGTEGLPGVRRRLWETFGPGDGGVGDPRRTGT